MSTTGVSDPTLASADLGQLALTVLAVLVMLTSAMLVPGLGGDDPWSESPLGAEFDDGIPGFLEDRIDQFEGELTGEGEGEGSGSGSVSGSANGTIAGNASGTVYGDGNGTIVGDGGGHITGDASGETAPDGLPDEGDYSPDPGAPVPPENGEESIDEADPVDPAEEEDVEEDEDESDENEFEEGDEEDSEIENGEDGYDIDIHGDVIPGQEVLVSVSDDGEPVEGAEVFFNGESIGTTDGSGEVAGEVPYSEELRVAVLPPSDESASMQSMQQHQLGHGGGQPTFASSNISVPTIAGLSLEVVGDNIPGSHVQTTVTISNTPVPDATIMVDGEVVGTTDENGEATVIAPSEPGELTIEATRGELATEETYTTGYPALEVVDRPMPGKTVGVEVTHVDEPLENASVRVNGEEVNTTDTDGTAEVELPDEPSNITIGAVHGEVAVMENVAVHPLEIAREDPFPLPGSESEFNVTWNDEPVAGVFVGVGGDEYAYSRTDGTVTLAMPLAAAATISAEYAGSTAETTVSGLLWNALLILVPSLLVVIAISWLLRRQLNSATRTIAAQRKPVIAWFRRLPGRGATLLVSIGRSIERLILALREQLRAVFGTIRAAVVQVLHFTKEIPVLVSALLSEVIWARVPSIERSRFVKRAQPEPAEDTTTTAPTLVEERWQQFLQVVQPPRVRTSTAGEIQRYAVSHGFPKRPVETIISIYRQCMYAGRDLEDTEIDRYERAIEETTHHGGKAD